MNFERFSNFAFRAGCVTQLSLAACLLSLSLQSAEAQQRPPLPQDVTVEGTEQGALVEPPPDNRGNPHCDQTQYLPDANNNCPAGYGHISTFTGAANNDCVRNPPDWAQASLSGHRTLWGLIPLSAQCGGSYGWSPPDCNAYSTITYQKMSEGGHDLGVHYADSWAMLAGASAACNNYMAIAADQAYWATLAHPQYYDDVVHGIFASLTGLDLTLGANNGTNMYCFEGGDNHQLGQCDTGYEEIDLATCRQVPWNLVYADCGGFRPQTVINYLWGSSPISLEWGDTRVESIGSLVMFSLDNTARQGWSLWRGSEKTPLLVYDPEHHGKITSNTQLFGSWTFGGKKLAALNGAPIQTEWKDGFEALATLDANHDSKISGAELKPLGLWFDKNQNGVAEPGEVVSLKDAGVNWLSVGPSVRNETEKSISVELGYERTTEHGPKVGRAVDWFASKYDDAFTLLSSLPGNELPLPGMSTVKPKTDSPIAVTPTRDESVAANDPAAPVAEEANPFYGAWSWTMDDPHITGHDGKQMGTLAFVGRGSDLRGMSLSLAQITGPKAKGHTIAHFQALDGTIEKLADGRRQLTFKVHDAPKTKILSQAIVEADGTSISGSTTETRQLSGGPLTVTYSWKGTKLPSPPANTPKVNYAPKPRAG